MQRDARIRAFEMHQSMALHVSSGPRPSHNLQFMFCPVQHTEAILAQAPSRAMGVCHDHVLVLRRYSNVCHRDFVPMLVLPISDLIYLLQNCHRLQLLPVGLDRGRNHGAFCSIHGVDYLPVRAPSGCFVQHVLPVLLLVGGFFGCHRYLCVDVLSLVHDVTVLDLLPFAQAKPFTVLPVKRRPPPTPVRIC